MPISRKGSPHSCLMSVGLLLGLSLSPTCVLAPSWEMAGDNLWNFGTPCEWFYEEMM